MNLIDYREKHYPIEKREKLEQEMLDIELGLKFILIK